MKVTVKQFWNLYKENNKLELENGVTFGWGACWDNEGNMLNDDDIVIIKDK